nr:MAG TPA: Initiation control protein YabA [Caudoviricetes sp.]
MPINRAFQRLKKPREDGFHAVCNPSKIKGCRT